MKYFFAVLLIIPCFALAAISSAIEWDIQGGVGVDTNGCGFKAGATGTDYSQVGATPHATLTTLSVVGASTSDITVSATDYTVSTNDVGNVVQITGGTATAGLYEIQSVTTGGAQKWTLDRAAGTTGQTVVASMGGSCNTPNKIMSEATAVVAGQTIHIKNATYSRTTAISLGASGSTANSSISVIGYNSAHRDILTWADMTNAPILTSATSAINIINTNNQTKWLFQAIHFTHTGSPTKGYVLDSETGTSITSFDLDFVDTTRGLTFCNSACEISVSRSEIKNSTGSGMTPDNAYVIDSWIHGGSSYGINGVDGQQLTIVRCVIDHNVTAGVRVDSPAASLTILDSTISYNTGATTDGITITTSGIVKFALVVNNVFYGNGRYNFSVAAKGAAPVFVANAWGGAGTSNTNGSVTTGISPITLTADPFTASGSNDFTLNNTSGGGLLLRKLGYPGAFPGGTMTGYADSGPLQHQDAAGSSSAGFIRLH